MRGVGVSWMFRPRAPEVLYEPAIPDDLAFPATKVTRVSQRTTLDGIEGVQLDTWYVLQLVADDAGGFTANVYQQTNPAVRGSYNLAMPAGRSWPFSASVWRCRWRCWSPASGC